MPVKYPSIDTTNEYDTSNHSLLAAILGAIADTATSTGQGLANTTLASILTALSGAATAAKQDIGNTSLASVLAALSSAATAARQDTGNTSLASILAAIGNKALDSSVLALGARYAAGTATLTVSPVVTTTSVKIASANVNRKGLILYNNSANSGYVAYGSAANSATNMTLIIPTFAHFVMPWPIYTGDLFAIRNGAGTGTFIVTELT